MSLHGNHHMSKTQNSSGEHHFRCLSGLEQSLWHLHDTVVCSISAGGHVGDDFSQLSKPNYDICRSSIMIAIHESINEEIS